MKVYKVVIFSQRTSAAARGKYCLVYAPIGKVVKALDGTMGIMCFENRADAEAFICKYPYVYGWVIIEVEGIGKPFRPRRVCQYTSGQMLDRYYTSRRGHKRRSGYTEQAPTGTICFPAVKVLT